MKGEGMNIFSGALIACLLWVMFPSTSVAESFRCGSHIIEEGMHRSKILEYCGQPTEEMGWTWHYDRGPGTLNMLVHFDADGTANRIEVEPDD
jgi:hypothetical protein